MAQRSRKKCEKIRLGERCTANAPPAPNNPTPPPDPTRRRHRHPTLSPPWLLTLVGQEEPQLPLHAEGMRSGSSSEEDGTAELPRSSSSSSRFLTQKKKKSLPAPAITFLRANMSSLRSNFSNADVPSGAFFPPPPPCFINGTNSFRLDRFVFVPLFLSRCGSTTCACHFFFFFFTQDSEVGHSKSSFYHCSSFWV